VAVLLYGPGTVRAPVSYRKIHDGWEMSKDGGLGGHRGARATLWPYACFAAPARRSARP